MAVSVVVAVALSSYTECNGLRGVFNDALCTAKASVEHYCVKLPASESILDGVFEPTTVVVSQITSGDLGDTFFYCVTSSMRGKATRCLVSSRQRDARLIFNASATVVVLFLRNLPSFLCLCVLLH